MVDKVKRRMVELAKLITTYDHEYYVLDNSIISDSQYDLFKRELERLEKDNPELRDSNSPTSRVGHGKSTLAQVKHLQPMYSLDNALNVDELLEWVDKLPSDPLVIVEPKLDGLSLNLLYLDNKLVSAITRGDGTTGEDVTCNARTISNLPLTLNGPILKGKLEVRGEVVMPKKVLLDLNVTAKDTGSKPLSNTRNAASGALRNSSPAITASRKLDFIAYDLGTNSLNLKTHTDTLLTLEQLGFTVGQYITGTKATGVTRVCSAYPYRDQLPYDIDGLVVKVNKLAVRAELGFTSRAPKWAIAYKFPPAIGKTKVLGIDTQVGRMGALTPVARLEPIPLGGVIVTNATLHNFEEIERLDIRVGDIVEICRSGDVIPKILKVVSNDPKRKQPKVPVPTECPVCGSEDLDYSQAVIRCRNFQGCRPQVIGQLAHYTTRKAMDIDGIAEATVETMVDNELLSHPLDYYRLTVESLTPYLGVKTATKLIARIKQSLIDVDPYRVLYGMGINNVGEGTAKRIMEVYQPHEVDKFNISLENIPDIGPITAGSITEYFNAPSNRDNYLKLVNLMTFKAPEKTSNELDGQTWVITGSFGELSREVVKAYLESMGAKVSNKVSKATTTLLVGDGKPGSKLKDAEDMNCNICTIMNTDAVHTVEDLMLPYEF